MKANKASEQYIPKSALVAEIEKLRDSFMNSMTKGIISMETFLDKDSTLIAIRMFLDTLEVKEVQEEPYVMSDKGKFTTTTK